jgi:hypothetical protein
MLVLTKKLIPARHLMHHSLTSAPTEQSPQSSSLSSNLL